MAEEKTNLSDEVGALTQTYSEGRVLLFVLTYVHAVEYILPNGYNIIDLKIHIETDLERMARCRFN